MEFLVFKHQKSGNAVVIPSAVALLIARQNSTMVYTVAGNGVDRMLWEVPGPESIELVGSYAAALETVKRWKLASDLGKGSDTVKTDKPEE